MTARPVARPGLVARARAALAVLRGDAPRTRSMWGTPWTGSATHHLTGSWSATQQSANREVEGSLIKLRTRARDLRRNHPLVARYAALSVENILGPDGMTLQATPGNTRGGVNERLRAECERVWYEWGETAGLDGRTWDDTAAALIDAWRTEGEALLEIVADERLPLGVGVQALDPDLLDETLTVEPGEGRAAVVQGIEYDGIGRPVAAHLWTRHPSEAGGRRVRRRVPLDRLRILADRVRPGQARGTTPLASVMYRLQMLGATVEALVDLNYVAARKMGWLKPGADSDIIGVGGDGETASVAPTYDVSVGGIEQLPPGYDFQAWDPGQPSQQFDPFAKLLLREVAAGLGVSYASLTGDLSDANYSSARVGLLAERERWRVLQRTFAATVCQPVYAAVIRAARLRGVLVAPATMPDAALAAATWHGRRWGWVDPAKDVAAIKESLAAGLTSLTRELNTAGIDRAELLREIAEERQQAASLGVTLDYATPDPAAAPSDDDAVPARPPLRALA